MTVPGHYYGTASNDHADQAAVYRPSTHLWYVRGHAPTPWGVSGDVPLTADFDGNGQADIAVYRPSTATWYAHGRPAVRFGAPDETPVQQAP